MKRKTIFAVLLVFALSVILITLAVAQPKVPAKHVPINPADPAEKCLRCHVSQGPPPPEQASFCLECHDFFFAHVTAPDPKHPVNFTWKAADCNACHRLHEGPNPTHQIGTQMRNADFCLACHIPGRAVSGEEKAGDFCARCHNLGYPAGHPTGEGKKADFCLQCHQKE